MLSASQVVGGRSVDGNNIPVKSSVQLRERNATSGGCAASDDMELARTDRCAGLNGAAGRPWAAAVQFVADMATRAGTLAQHPAAC